MYNKTILSVRISLCVSKRAHGVWKVTETKVKNRNQPRYSKTLMWTRHGSRRMKTNVIDSYPDQVTNVDLDSCQ